jgi:hypothetical protein
VSSRPELADLLASRTRLQEAADAGRRAIERARHDGVQQELVAASVRIQLVQRLVADDPAEAGRLLGELARDLHDALEGVRALAERVYPGRLAPFGLAEALRAAGLEVDDHLLGRPAQAVEACAYFLAQDLCGGRGSVRLGREGAEVVLRLRPDELDEARLTAARDRAEAAGGSLEVEWRDDRAYVSAAIPDRPSDR